MRDEEYAPEQIGTYGDRAQPAVVERMAPHVRMTQVGTVFAALAVALGILGLVRYPDFAGASSGATWVVVNLVAAVVTLDICIFQVLAWRRALKVWRGELKLDLSRTSKLSWVVHLVSYLPVLVALWACLTASASAGFGASASTFLTLSLLSQLIAQVLAAVQYVRVSGPPGTVPNHMRQLIERERAKAGR